MNAFYFNQRLSARILAAVALFSLVASLVPMQAFATQQVLIFSASVNPASIGVGQTVPVTFTIGNNISSTKDIKAIRISVPAGFSAANFAISQANWGVALNSGEIQASLNSGPTGLIPGNQLTITANITNVSASGTTSWTTCTFINSSFAPGAGGDFNILGGTGCASLAVSAPPPPIDVCSNITGDQATVPLGYYAEGGQCFLNPVDVCPNITGAQATVPTGMMIDTSGNCVDIPPPPVDVCDNLTGDQATVPQGYVQNGDNCDPITVTVDVCPNITGDQATVPTGMMIDTSGNCVDIPPPPVDVCDNLTGDQATVPQGYVQNGDNCDLIPPPPVDLCSNITGDQASIPQGYHLEGDSTCVPNDTDPDPIYGCTDDSAVNYSPRANIDDESCIYNYVSQCIGDTPNLLANASFEDSVGLGNNAWGIFTNVPSWTHTLSSGIEIWQNLLITPSQGIQNVELDGDDATKITQTVATIPGATYELRFDFAARSADAADNHISAAADGLVINESTDYTNWVTYGGTFTSDASTVVSFEDLGTPQDGGGTGTLLDNAVLCLVRVPVVDFCPNIVGNQVVDSYQKDINGQCYTPIDSCEITVVSGTSDIVNETGALVIPTVNQPGVWVDNIVDSIAQWIWGSAPGSAIDPVNDETQTFTKTFVWSGTPATAILKIAADNTYTVELNGNPVGGETVNIDNFTSVDTIINISDDLIQGVNTLEISVTNKANGQALLEGNPAGLLYDLTITNTTGDCAPDGGGDNDDELSCSITASENSIRRGRDVTITWSSVDAAYVTIPNLGDELGTSGSQLVENLGEDTTYTMTVFGDVIGNTDTREQATCSVTVDTRSGGGGGGGNRVDRTPDGDVLGASDDKKPTGEVLGAQTDAIPTGAPNTGKGGSSTEVFGQFLATPRRRNHA